MHKIKDDDINVVKKKKKKSVDKAKMKVGSKNKKKGKKKKNFANDESEHQEFCEVCQQGGEILMCDTCPKAYHLVCLDPKLDKLPEGKWSCPHCETNGPENMEVDPDAELEEMLKIKDDDNTVAKEKKKKSGDKAKMKDGSKNKKKGKKKKNFAYEESEHQEYCEVCQQGGEIVVCDFCPKAYHLGCLDPPLEDAPGDMVNWACHHCLVKYFLEFFLIFAPIFFPFF